MQKEDIPQSLRKWGTTGKSRQAKIRKPQDESKNYNKAERINPERTNKKQLTFFLTMNNVMKYK